MEIITPSSLGSIYFITDPNNGIGCVPQYPYKRFDLLFYAGELNFEAITNFLARPRTKPTGYLQKLFADRELFSPEETAKALHQLFNDQKLTSKVDFVRPLGIVAESIHPDLLKTIKVAKLRGYWQTLAVTTDNVESIAKDFSGQSKQRIAYQSQLPYCIGFEDIKSIRMVSSPKTTVISDQSESQILKRHPQLRSKMDREAFNEAI